MHIHGRQDVVLGVTSGEVWPLLCRPRTLVCGLCRNNLDKVDSNLDHIQIVNVGNSVIKF
jgi:hypothetical protein